MVRNASLFPFLLAVLLVLAPLAVASVSTPTLAAGDFFDETLSTTTSGATTTLHAHEVVDSLTQIAVGGVAHDAYKEVQTSQTNTTSGGYTVTSTTTTTSWIATSDLAGLRSETSTQTASSIPNFPGTTSTSTTEYAAPCAVMRWSFDVASHWSTTCTSWTNGTTSSRTTTYYNVTVLRAEAVTVPAGTFQAYVLNITAADSSTGVTTTTFSWYAPLACNVVKTQTTTAGGTVEAELTSYKCQSTSSQGGTTTTTTSSSTTSTTTSSTSTTTSTAATSTTSTTSTGTTPSSAPTKTPGPELALLVAGVAAVAVLAARKRA